MRGRAHKPEQCAGFMSVLINEKRISVFHLTTFRRQGCRRKRAQASRRGRIGSTYPKGFKSPSGQERANPSSAQDLRASPMKEKRCRRFSTSDLIRVNPSSGRSRYIRAPLTYRIFAVQKYAAVVLRYDTASMPCIEESSPRDLQRARSAKFPAQDLM